MNRQGCGASPVRGALSKVQFAPVPDLSGPSLAQARLDLPFTQTIATAMVFPPGRRPNAPGRRDHPGYWCDMQASCEFQQRCSYRGFDHPRHALPLAKGRRSASTAGKRPVTRSGCAAMLPREIPSVDGQVFLIVGPVARSVFLTVLCHFAFDQPRQPVRQAAPVGVSEFPGLLLELAIDAKIDDLFFWH